MISLEKKIVACEHKKAGLEYSTTYITLVVRTHNDHSLKKKRIHNDYISFVILKCRTKEIMGAFILDYFSKKKKSIFL